MAEHRDTRKCTCVCNYNRDTRCITGQARRFSLPVLLSPTLAVSPSRPLSRALNLEHTQKQFAGCNIVKDPCTSQTPSVLWDELLQQFWYYFIWGTRSVMPIPHHLLHSSSVKIIKIEICIALNYEYSSVKRWRWNVIKGSHSLPPTHTFIHEWN